MNASFSVLTILCIAIATPLRAENRSYDGSGNNLAQPTWGAVETTLRRKAVSAYTDGGATMAGHDRPNPRDVSNRIAHQRVLTENRRGLADMTWVWGQFLDHDIALVLPTADEFIPIMAMNAEDKMAPMIPLTRSRSTMKDAQREQVNSVTAYIDASNLYGSNEERARALRQKVGGLMHASADGKLLPKNFEEIEMENPHHRPVTDLYMAGDVRANENPALISIHTLWLREHNRWATQLAEAHPEWTDEQLYQKARKMVSGQIQAITYQEFLAALLGPYAPKVEEAAYDPTLNSTLFNEFSGALYRIGHTMVSAHIMRMHNDGSVPADGGFVFKESFFNPELVNDAQTVDLVLKGVATKPMQQIDPFVVDALRNFLFAEQGAGGMDLIAINLQRGRDHGLPPYNDVREAFGLTRKERFEDITSDRALASALAEAYGGDVGKLDLWIAAMAEDHMGEASVGETVATVLATQFRHLRDGDRFFFMHDPDLTDAEKAQIRETTLAQVIRRNTSITQLQDQVFFAQPYETWKDTDADGVTDIREAIARTDPTDPNSRLRVLQVTEAGDAVTLEWSSIPGKEYLIEYSATLEGAWEIVANIIAEETATAAPLIRHGAERGFYRIAVRD